MKVYPRHATELNPEGGFTADEIRRGVHWLHTDVQCVACGKVQTLANAGSTDNGQCISCGGRTA